MADMKDTQFLNLSQVNQRVPLPEMEASLVLEKVYEALKEKGYNPVTQIVGYLISGDPTYITNHKSARSLIMKAERDELITELVENYISTKL